MFPGRAVPLRNAEFRDSSGTLGAQMILGDQVRRRLGPGSKKHDHLIFPKDITVSCSTCDCPKTIYTTTIRRPLMKPLARWSVRH